MLNGHFNNAIHAVYFLSGICGVGLLAVAARKMYRAKQRFSKLAVFLVGLSIISLFYNGPISMYLATGMFFYDPDPFFGYK